MNRKRILLISSIILMTTLLFTAYNSSMHIFRPRGVTAASGGGGTMGLGVPMTFERAIEGATDVVVAEFVAQRPVQDATEYEFIVHDRVFGNAPDTIFVYVTHEEMNRRFIGREFHFNTGTQYLLALIKLADVYSHFHENGFLFRTNLILDLNDPPSGTMNNQSLSLQSYMNFNSRNLTSERIVSYVSTLSWTPFQTAERVYIISHNLEDIIDGSPYVLVVEINELERPTSGRPTDIYYTTVVEVLKGDMQVGDILGVIFFADTVFPGETHIVSTTPSCLCCPTSLSHRFTSRNSLHCITQRDEIIAIISETTPPPPINN